MSKPRLLDVCAGIGGFSLAATWAGYEVAGQVEIDPWCRRVLAKHWPDAIRMSDVFEVRGDEFGPIDLLTAGIPCQPYSVAGKRRGNDDDRAIWPAVRDVIAVAQPPRVLIENVAGFIGMALDGVSADLEALGYEVRSFVIPACAVGAPHRRDRVWILAAHTDSESQPVIPGDGDTGRWFVGSRDVADAAARGVRRGEPSRQPGLAARGGEVGADPDGAGLEGRIERAERAGERPAGPMGGEPFSAATDTGRSLHDPDGGRHRGSDDEVRAGRDGTLGSGGRDALGCMGDESAGLPGRLSGWAPGPGVSNPWAGDWEAGCPRITVHEPDRVHKLKALGNAVVPSLVYQILTLWDGEA